MFRDSRGVVHTVSSADPLDDLPEQAGEALARTLLVPCEGDLGSLLERCEAVVELLERWQDAFFADLPAEIDLEEEARWAEQAGLTLADVEGDWEDDDEGGDEDDDDELDDEELPGQEALDLQELVIEPLFAWTSGLDEEVVTELETGLMLLPMRSRLEALVAATAVVNEWVDLLADHEKCLGHLVLVHGVTPEQHPHEALVDHHARLHAGRARHCQEEVP